MIKKIRCEITGTARASFYGAYYTNAGEVFQYMIDACHSKWPNATHLCRVHGPEDDLYDFEIRKNPGDATGVIKISLHLRIDDDFFEEALDNMKYDYDALIRQVNCGTDADPPAGYTLEKDWTIDVEWLIWGEQHYWKALQTICSEMAGDLRQISLRTDQVGAVTRILDLLLRNLRPMSKSGISIDVAGYPRSPAVVDGMWTMNFSTTAAAYSSAKM